MMRVSNSLASQMRFNAAGRIAPVSSALICFLALLAAQNLSAQSAVRLDSLVGLVRGLYEQGSYLSSEVEARRLLDNRSVPDSLRVRAEQYLAFSLIAQSKNAGAVDHLVTILRIDSTFSLDPVLTSPKILSVFADAYKQYESLKLSERSLVRREQQPQGHSVTFRTVLFPGWDQTYQGRTAKGYTLIGVGILSLGATFYFDRERRSAQDDYLAANTPELAASRYTRYNNFHKAEYYSLAAFIAIYIYSQFDAFFDLPPRLDPAVSQSSSNVQLTLHFPL
jgi:hypothetical protein